MIDLFMLFAQIQPMDTALTSIYELNPFGGRTVTTTITRAMLCEAATLQTGLDRLDVCAIAESMFEMMGDALMAGENVKLTAFGSLQVRRRAQRIGRNPRTGTEHPISPRQTVVFIPSAQLRGSLNSEIALPLANEIRQSA